MPKTAREQLNADKTHKIAVLHADFAGIKKGQKMFVATPKIVDAYIKAIPAGETRTIARMRNELARRRKCDAMCPVSTAIFVRISAQAALDQFLGVLNGTYDPPEPAAVNSLTQPITVFNRIVPFNFGNSRTIEETTFS